MADLRGYFGVFLSGVGRRPDEGVPRYWAKFAGKVAVQA